MISFRLSKNFYLFEISDTVVSLIFRGIKFCGLRTCLNFRVIAKVIIQALIKYTLLNIWSNYIRENFIPSSKTYSLDILVTKAVHSVIITK